MLVLAALEVWMSCGPRHIKSAIRGEPGDAAPRADKRKSQMATVRSQETKRVQTKTNQKEEDGNAHSEASMEIVSGHNYAGNRFGVISHLRKSKT